MSISSSSSSVNSFKVKLVYDGNIHEVTLYEPICLLDLYRFLYRQYGMSQSLLEDMVFRFQDWTKDFIILDSDTLLKEAIQEEHVGHQSLLKVYPSRSIAPTSYRYPEVKQMKLSSVVEKNVVETIFGRGDVVKYNNKLYIVGKVINDDVRCSALYFIYPIEKSLHYSQMSINHINYSDINYSVSVIAQHLQLVLRKYDAAPPAAKYAVAEPVRFQYLCNDSGIYARSEWMLQGKIAKVWYDWINAEWTYTITNDENTTVTLRALERHVFPAKGDTKDNDSWSLAGEQLKKKFVPIMTPPSDGVQCVFEMGDPVKFKAHADTAAKVVRVMYVGGDMQWAVEVKMDGDSGPYVWCNAQDLSVTWVQPLYAVGARVACKYRIDGSWSTRYYASHVHSAAYSRSQQMWMYSIKFMDDEKKLYADIPEQHIKYYELCLTCQALCTQTQPDVKLCSICNYCSGFYKTVPQLSTYTIPSEGPWQLKPIDSSLTVPKHPDNTLPVNVVPLFDDASICMNPRFRQILHAVFAMDFGIKSYRTDAPDTRFRLWYSYLSPGSSHEEVVAEVKNNLFDKHSVKGMIQVDGFIDYYRVLYANPATRSRVYADLYYYGYDTLLQPFNCKGRYSRSIYTFNATTGILHCQQLKCDDLVTQVQWY